MLDWLLAFTATILIELPLVALLTRRPEWPLRRRLLTALAGQAITHPLVWFVFPALPGNAELWFWSSEVTAVALEATLYARSLHGLGPLRALAISALANAASLAAGVAWDSLAR